MNGQKREERREKKEERRGKREERREKKEERRRRNHRYLDRRRVERPGKLLGLRLPPFDHGNRQKLRVDPLIKLQNLPDFALRLLLRRKRRVALLPEELAGPDERRGVLELPPDDVGPLVEAEREVAPRADPVGEVGVP